MGFGLEVGFIDHLDIVTTSNYNAITDLHTLQFAAAHAKPSQSAFTSRFPEWILTMEILQLLCSRCYSLASIPQLNSSALIKYSLHRLTPRLAATLQQCPSSCFTDWLTADSWPHFTVSVSRCPHPGGSTQKRLKEEVLWLRNVGQCSQHNIALQVQYCRVEYSDM
jgi:hypothetical protein